MPFYSREDCDRVRAGNDIVDVISSYIKLDRRGSRYFGLCPFHNEKTGSFCVSSDSQLYHCFGCHESGNVVSFLMRYESMEYTEAIEALAERAGIELQSVSPGKSDSGEYRQKREAMLAANKAAAGYYYKKLREPEGERALKYFKDRGLDSNILRDFGLGYTGKGSGGLHHFLREQGFDDELLKDAGLILFDEKNGVRDRFFNRVMFPIMDANRHVIAFGARVMGDGQPKYLNSSESMIFNKSQTLFGLFAARRSKRPQIIVCEGYMDVISSHMAGFDNAVATLGTALTEEHAKILARYKRPVYLCYDSDEAGKKAAIRGYDILFKAGINCKIIDLGEYKDPDELIKAKGADAFEKCIDNAKNAFFMIRDWEYEVIDKSDPDEMSDFKNRLISLLKDFTNDAARDTYLKESARRYSIEESQLRRWVNTAGEKAGLYKDERPILNRRNPGISIENTQKSIEAKLLYYLLEEDFFSKAIPLLEREDFVNDECRDIFDQIVEATEENKKLEAADIISRVENPEARNFISQNFVQASEEKTLDKKVLSNNKRELIRRIKKASVKRADGNRDSSDIEGLRKSMEISKELFDEIDKIDFM